MSIYANTSDSTNSHVQISLDPSRPSQLKCDKNVSDNEHAFVTYLKWEKDEKRKIRKL